MRRIWLVLPVLAGILLSGCAPRRSLDYWELPQAVTDKTPAVQDSLVVVAQNALIIYPTGQILVVNTATGKLVATRTVPADTYRAADVGPMGDIVVTGNKHVCCLDKSGQLRWSVTVDDCVQAAAGQEPAYTVSPADALFGLTETGQAVWRNSEVAGPVASLGNAIVARRKGDNASLVGLRCPSGAELWDFGTPPYTEFQDLIQSSGRCIAAFRQPGVATSINDLATDEWNYRPCRLVSINPSGGTDWTLDLSRRFFGVDLLPAKDGAFVVGGSFDPEQRGPEDPNDFVVCVSSDGRVLWEQPLPYHVVTPAISDGSSLFVPEEDGTILELDSTGELRVVAQVPRGDRSHVALRLVSVIGRKVYFTVNRWTFGCISLSR